MYVFMNEYYSKEYDIIAISGVYYYMIEMMQFLKDKYNIQNIKEFIDPQTETNRNIVHSRYTYSFDTINTLNLSNIDILFLSMNSLLTILSKDVLYYNVLYNIPKICLLNADGILELLYNECKKSLKIYSRYNKIKTKIYLLHEYGFENDFYQKCGLKIISIVRGLYFKYFKKMDIKYIKYFMFTRLHDTIYTHTEKDLQKAHQYCLEQNIEYTTEHCINPASQYKGLIYFRYHDYMPRLPYEFWYYNKDVRLVQISDGLQKRMKQYGQNIFDWNLDEVMK